MVDVFGFRYPICKLYLFSIEGLEFLRAKVGSNSQPQRLALANRPKFNCLKLRVLKFVVHKRSLNSTSSGFSAFTMWVSKKKELLNKNRNRELFKHIAGDAPHFCHLFIWINPGATKRCLLFWLVGCRPPYWFCSWRLVRSVGGSDHVCFF